MVIIAYIKNILLLSILLTILIFLYPFLSENHPIELYYKNGVIYTTQNALILFTAGISVVSYIFIKVVYIVIAKGFFIPDAFYFILKILSKFRKEHNNILDRINTLKKQKKYKQALQITENNFQDSSEILFQHFFLLLKLNKKSTFLRTFKRHQCGKAIPLFMSLTKDWSSWRKNLFISRLYSKNQNNDVITYLYAKNLVTNKQNDKSYKLVTNFITNKFVFFKDQYTFYLFNRLALQLEMIESEGSADFATTYIENIKNYHDASLQEKRKSK